MTSIGRRHSAVELSHPSSGDQSETSDRISASDFSEPPPSRTLGHVLEHEPLFYANHELDSIERST